MSLAQRRLITLVGAGGVGKTRLALQVAAAEVADYEDGAWFCELAPASGDDAVTTIVASVLGARQQPGESLFDSLIAFLRYQSMVLILDNCEHVIDAAADLAEAVLRSCPRVRMIATSREALAIPGEQLTAVPTLDVPEDDALAASSVELFRDRAMDRGADRAMLDRSHQAIAEIARRLDGLPLALELAAARITSLTPADILAHLEQRFSLLTGGTRRRRDRARTLEQAIDWSYDLLAEDEQEVFRRLGVIAASFDLETTWRYNTRDSTSLEQLKPSIFCN